MKFFKDKSKLYCFSPEVMLATFVIEFTLALVLFVKYKLNPKTRVCILVLLGLGLFQLAEYRICAGSSMMFWSYIGFTAITLLPAFGLDFITLADKDRKRWVPLGYVLSLIMIFSIFYFSLIEGAVCGGNYVIFEMSFLAQTTFFTYYMALIFLGLFLCIRDYRSAKKKGIPVKKQLYFWIIVGYSAFLVPTGVVYLLATQTNLPLSAAPSIMCGFAVVFSFIVFFKIVPALFIMLSHHAQHKHTGKK